MGRCTNHPEIQTQYHCMKHDIYLCEDCLECRDPELYCKFRSACPIHFMSKKGFKDPVPPRRSLRLNSTTGRLRPQPATP